MKNKIFITSLVLGSVGLIASGCTYNNPQNYGAQNSVTPSTSIQQVPNTNLPGPTSTTGNSSNSTSSSEKPVPAAPTSTSLTVKKGPAAVTIKDFAFDPQILTIKKGTKVTWTNQDAATHQIKSTAFNSQELSKGQSFSYTFDETGTIDYFCSIHPTMTGKVIVQ